MTKTADTILPNVCTTKTDFGAICAAQVSIVDGFLVEIELGQAFDASLTYVLNVGVGEAVEHHAPDTMHRFVYQRSTVNNFRFVDHYKYSQILVTISNSSTLRIVEKKMTERLKEEIAVLMEARRVWNDKLVDKCLKEYEEIFGADEQFTDLEKFKIILYRAPELIMFDYPKDDVKTYAGYLYEMLKKSLVDIYQVPEASIDEWITRNHVRESSYWRKKLDEQLQMNGGVDALPPTKDALYFRTYVRTGIVGETEYIVDLSDTPRVKKSEKTGKIYDKKCPVSCEKRARLEWGDMLIDECLRNTEKIFGKDQFTDLERSIILIHRAPELVDFTHLRSEQSEEHTSTWNFTRLLREVIEHYNVPEVSIDRWMWKNRVYTCNYWVAMTETMTFMPRVTTGTADAARYIVDINSIPYVKRIT